jgi:outer membrane protein
LPQFHSLRSFTLPTLVALSLTLGACAPASPGVGGAEATSPAPERVWTPPPPSEDRTTPLPPPLVLPAEFVARRDSLTLADLVDLSLRNSPDTRLAWENAKARAAAYGSSRGLAYPQVDGSMGITGLQNPATQGRQSVQQVLYIPSVSFNWLILDLGGRSGTIGAAREALLAADWTHNAIIADVVLRTARAYYDYIGFRALLQAQRTTLEEQKVNLAAAEDRRRVGVATIADVLQARTAVSQALLAVQTTEGQVRTARGALATAAGFPATADLDADVALAHGDIAEVADSVDTLVKHALDNRPDLAAAQATYAAAQQRTRAVKSARLPSISASGSAGRNIILSTGGGGGNFYSLGFSLAVPLFNGFSWEYNTREAEALAEMESARTASLAQQVTYQVFAAYEAQRTASQRVRTSDELLASATASAEAALARYKEGVGGLIDLLAAENALADARAQRIQARLQWYSSLVQLAHDAALLDPDGGARIRLTEPTDSTK